MTCRAKREPENIQKRLGIKLEVIKIKIGKFSLNFFSNINKESSFIQKKLIKNYQKFTA